MSDRQIAPGAITSQPTSSDALETAGSGKVIIGMITSADAHANDYQIQRDRIDGAKLAVEELGAQSVYLNIINSDGSTPAVVKAAQDLTSRGARMIVSSVGPDATAQIGRALDNHALPVIALYSNALPLPEGFYSFASDRLDSLAEAASYALATGRKSVVLLAGPDAGASEVQRLDAEFKRFGPAYVGSVRLTQAGQPNGIDASRIADADAIAIVSGQDEIPSVMKSSLVARSLAGAGKMVVITAVRSLAQPLPSGRSQVVFCRYEQKANSSIGARYLRRFGRPVSLDAAYGYDSIALATGLSRGLTGDSPAHELLTSESGFSGALGLFRFNTRGRVQRNCDIFKVQGTNITLLQKAPLEF